MMELDIQELIETYLLTNSPDQLYKSFIESDIPKELAENESIDVLVEEYRRRTTLREKSVDDVVISYAIIFAGTQMGTDRAMEYFNQLDLDSLSWGKWVVERYLQERRITIYSAANGLAMIVKQHTGMKQAKNSYSERSEKAIPIMLDFNQSVISSKNQYENRIIE